MKTKLSILALALLCGCARFSTKQEDISYDYSQIPSFISTDSPPATISAITSKPSRKITTTVSGWTFFDAKSELAKFKATQTDRSQGASVGSLNNQTSGTNAVAVLEKIAAILNALPK